MNCCRETTKMGGPPGNRPAVPRDWFPYLNGTSRGPTPEDARKDGDIIRARCASVFAKASPRQAAQSRKRVPSFVVAVTPRREFTKYPG
jgi:hypothetical protein